jgi:hypothetical protein
MHHPRLADRGLVSRFFATGRLRQEMTILRTPLSALLLTPLFLLVAGCNDHHLLTPPEDASFHHQPGHGGGGGKDSGAQGNYEVILLGTSSTAWAGNRAGVVVGTSQGPDGEIAFVWTESEGIVELEYVGGARDVNEGGTLSGFSFWQGGFVYDIPTSVLTLLPPLPGHTSTNGIAINDDGWVGGRSAGTLDSGASDWQTVVWIPEADGGYAEPYDLQCPDMQVHMDINQRGDVVANGCAGTWSPPYVWIWNGEGYDAPIALGTLGGFTYAVSMDDRGRVVGWSNTSQGTSERRAVLWHPDDYSAPIDLGSTAFVFVQDMSNGNQVVGYQSTRSRDTAVVWTVDDAGNTIAFHELPGVSGYDKAHALGITDEGWIVGRVFNDSESMAAVWRPLEDDGGSDDDCRPHPRFPDRCR